jgi:hypothetical protein
VDRIRAKYELLAPVMDERMTRLWAAAEAKALRHGGIAAVTAATGILGDDGDRRGRRGRVFASGGEGAN